MSTAYSTTPALNLTRRSFSGNFLFCPSLHASSPEFLIRLSSSWAYKAAHGSNTAHASDWSVRGTAYWAHPAARARKRSQSSTGTLFKHFKEYNSLLASTGTKRLSRVGVQRVWLLSKEKSSLSRTSAVCCWRRSKNQVKKKVCCGKGQWNLHDGIWALFHKPGLRYFWETVARKPLSLVQLLKCCKSKSAHHGLLESEVLHAEAVLGQRRNHQGRIFWWAQYNDTSSVCYAVHVPSLFTFGFFLSRFVAFFYCFELHLIWCKIIFQKKKNAYHLFQKNIGFTKRCIWRSHFQA